MNPKTQIYSPARSSGRGRPTPQDRARLNFTVKDENAVSMWLLLKYARFLTDTVLADKVGKNTHFLP